MSKPPELIEPADGGVTLRLYRTPWQGEVLFACRKCQRRVKRNDGPAALSKLKSWFKARSRKQQRTPLRVIDMTCVKLCPNDGVTVFSRRHLAHEPAGVCIARNEDDLETLYCELTDVALSSAKLTL
jgi:hypothetical protein